MIKKRKIHGFSLVELMVSASIFVVVLGFVGGTFSLFVSRQKQQINQQLLQQEVQNFLEVIERDVRTAYGETFNDPIVSSSNTQISFKNQEQKTKPVAERLEHSYLLGSESVGAGVSIGRVYYNDGVVDVVTGTSKQIPITSDKINVKNIEFKWNKGVTETGSGSDNIYIKGVPLRLTIALEVCRREDPTSCLKTQATIASRQTKPIDEKL